MNIPVKRWYEAVQTRYSQQKFMEKDIKEFTLKSLEKKIKELNEVYPEVRIEVVKKSIKDILPALKGKYGNFTDSPAFLAFIIDDKGEHRWTKMGYIGEAAILEATALGLGSCWVGARYIPDRSTLKLNLKKDERLVAVTPIGYSSENYNLTRHFISKLFPHRDRKDIKELCPDGYDVDWPGWVKNAIKLGSYAPSRLNRQPWRFYYGDGRLVVDCKGEPSAYKRLECGIALLHVEIGALDGGVNGSVEYGGLGLASFIRES
ncbi:MAG: nitroreductase family protein [Halanaerobium sp.]